MNRPTEELLSITGEAKPAFAREGNGENDFAIMAFIPNKAAIEFTAVEKFFCFCLFPNWDLSEFSFEFFRIT